jgi:hypothetical protein
MDGAIAASTPLKAAMLRGDDLEYLTGLMTDKTAYTRIFS